jgi:steroid 5-alpha reductase family enzyme
MSKVEGIKYSFYLDRIIVMLAYLVAIAGGWAAALFFPDHELWVKLAIGDFVATVIIFISSVIFKNSSMYDPYWSVLPIFILLYIILSIELAGLSVRLVLVSAVVLYWGVRLTVNWLRTWPGLGHQDWRYIKLSRDTGPFYWLVSFLGIHLMPTVLVFIACLPLIPVLSSDQPLLWSDLLGFLIAFGAVEIERRADNQLRQYKNSADLSKSKVCEIGLWRYSRHPNYFGEIAFWGGLFVMAYGLNTGENLIYGSGFLLMVLLFVFISIPMMEKRQLNKEGYAEYRKRVWMLVPWFRKK